MTKASTSAFPPTLVLDLDGTIVDSVPDLTSVLNRVMERRGLAPFTTGEAARMVGDGVERLVERAFAARGQAPDAAAVAEYVTDYDQCYACKTRLFPGAAETLAQMHSAGWILAVCTNKLERPARALLGTLGVGELFAGVGGGDSFPVRKPDPAHLLATLKAAGGRPERAVMAGDHRNDIAAALGAGLPCIFAAWGYGTPEMAEGATVVAERFGDLPGIASRLVAAV